MWYHKWDKYAISQKLQWQNSTENMGYEAGSHQNQLL